MIYFLLFASEIILIFLLSRRVQRVLSHFLMRITGNKNTSVYVMALLFLPGTFVHEVSHFLAALFLLVPVGNMQLLPEIEEDGVRLGSVGIAKTDPIRRFIIGAAPLFVGVLIIVLTFYFLPLDQLIKNLAQALLVVYGIFTISNSMFSSKKDMEGLWGFVFVMVFFSILFWFFGIRVDFSLFLNKFSEVFKSASLFLTLPILIDVLILMLIPKRTWK